MKTAIARGVDLSALSLAELQAFNAAIGDDVFQVLTLRGASSTLVGWIAQRCVHQMRSCQVCHTNMPLARALLKV